MNNRLLYPCYLLAIFKDLSKDEWYYHFSIIQLQREPPPDMIPPSLDVSHLILIKNPSALFYLRVSFSPTMMPYLEIS